MLDLHRARAIYSVRRLGGLEVERGHSQELRRVL